MNPLFADAPGTRVLLMGNEAIARGAIEAGVAVCAGYPGNPSSEIIGALAGVAGELNMHVEWSTNEKVAMEVAAAASFAGLRGMTAMKQNGLNVAADFLFNLSLSGSKGGLVIVVAEDPSGLSSTNEQDTRAFAKMGDLPLFEPSTPAEAMRITRQAFELSEEFGLPCIVRSVTRVSHARGVVELGLRPAPEDRPAPAFDRSRPFLSFPALANHRALKEKLARARSLLEGAPLNFYEGPDRPELIVVAAGTCWAYTREAIALLGVEDRVGVIKLGSSWPLPAELLRRHLADVPHVLVTEEVDTFLEAEVKALCAQGLWSLRSSARRGCAPSLRAQGGLRPGAFHGREAGELPAVGELSVDLVLGAIARILEVPYRSRPEEYARRAAELQSMIPARQVGLCAGCPHRATYWAVKNALALDGREGVVLGDIGCYSLGFGPSGFNQLSTLHAMGSGPGLAGGMSRLKSFGLTQPVLTLVGDSTFYHAALPALVNGRYNSASFVMLVLDNSATAMTGFQPHPGIGVDAMGRAAPVVEIAEVCRSLGLKVTEGDPFDMEGTIETILGLMKDEAGIKVHVLRRMCGLLAAKREPAGPGVRIDVERCLGAACGCNRLCTRVFRCPGLSWDAAAGKASVDEAVCNRCGYCVQICPAGAIVHAEVDDG
jgi:indolepyruvate ferredoxin oxidoreductase alpha subunit